ncbi:uncharacterized protein LOC121870679 [Homarus americanus]|uniref:uncharacterized protein LOC121870679 n=1 Tax=Homarus americanus TaxID=6706 RepID=UPI001C482DE3|nr:uncharacterized protein LOC121870679 [Homarus americanus]
MIGLISYYSQWILHFSDKRSVSFMFHSKKLGNIKNDKIQRWRVERACFDYDIVYQPGTENSTADALSRAFCSATNHKTLSDLHQQLCRPGVTRMAHFIHIRNLPYSVDVVKKGPLPSTSRNRYLLTVVDEHSRFPFAFACKDMTAATVIKCLRQLFAIFGMPA